MNNVVSLENVPCPLGCEESDGVVTIGRDRLHNLPGNFTVVKCNVCGLMRTNPRPTADTIGFYYPEDYGPYLSTRVVRSESYFPEQFKNIFRPLVRKIFNNKADVLPPITPGRLLEIGCASGSYLQKMADSGWQVEGIEFSEDAANIARQLGHPVYAGSLESAPTPENPFDLIVGWMVLEHLHSPVLSLKKLHEWAKPGAWLALSIPDAGSLEFKAFKNKWYDLHLPNHLYHFTPNSLEKVLQESGWTLTKIHHQRNANNLFVSIAYVLEDRGWIKLSLYFKKLAELSGIWSYIKFPFGLFLGSLKQSGRMTVWARKSQ